MDSSLTKDIHFMNPNRLVSVAIPAPTDDQKKQPVMVLVHGFSASTFEFEAFKSAVQEKVPSVLFSSVIMGGHGEDYHAFKSATFADWLAPITQEVTALAELGYSRIFLFGVSTGATGILHELITGRYEDVPINHVFLMDTFIQPVDNRLHALPVLKHVVTNTHSGAVTPIEKRHWYVNRPTAALLELLTLIKRVRARLKQPLGGTDVDMTLFTAEFDPVGRSSGTTTIASYFPKARVVRYESNRHVIIESMTPSDWNNNDQRHFDAVIEVIESVIQNKNNL